MSTTGWILGAAGGWLAASPILAVTLGRAMRWADQGPTPPQPAADDYPTGEIVVPLRWLPPVPPLASRHTDADWLDAWPADACDTGEIRRRFDQITQGWAA